MPPSTKIIDVLGIGFGPSNMALAIANEEEGSPLDMHFIDQADGPCWHPEMLLGGSDIQNNPLRDLVTPRNPKSHYTFTNYLKCTGRLFDYLNLGLHYPLRKDYAQYVKWVAGFFDPLVSYSTGAEKIDVDQDRNLWIVQTNQGEFAARSLILGTGRSRNIPDFAAEALGPRVFHLNDYLARTKALGPNPKSIAVLGASQSAVEINLDLMKRFPNTEIHAIHRSFAFKQKDTSPFSDYVYFPEFIEYFHEVGDEGRANLQAQLRGTNYSSADKDVLQQLVVSIYEEGLDDKHRVHIHNNTVIEGISAREDCAMVDIRERFLDTTDQLSVDAVILATGFKDLGVGPGKELFPPILADVAEHLERRFDNALHVRRDYRVENHLGPDLYLNGLCESSHGLGDAGSFSLLSLRSTEILASLQAHLTRPQAHQNTMKAPVDPEYVGAD